LSNGCPQDDRLMTGARFGILSPLPDPCFFLAERWFLFAQANHSQNLYYQVIS
jgi:hypothetical protein